MGNTWRDHAKNNMQADLDRELEGPIGNRYKELVEQNKSFTKNLNVSIKISGRMEQAQRMTALTQARAEYTGHDWYIWHTAEDVRVRPSHKNMSGVLCRFSDPPDPEELIGEESIGRYSPGVSPECRCYAAPVILWKNVTWPHRIYADGRIQLMSKEEFAYKFHAEKLEYWV